MAEAEKAALRQDNAMDVPFLSAVLGLQSKKRRGPSTDADSGAASASGGTPKPVLVNKRGVPNDSTYGAWDPERKRGRWTLTARPDAEQTTPLLPTLSPSPSRAYPRVPGFYAAAYSPLTSEALAAHAAATGTPPRSGAPSLASPPPGGSQGDNYSSIGSEDGDAKAFFAECPKEVPEKAAYWIMKNDLLAHVNGAKLKNSIKEARNLLERIRGKPGWAGPYSKLTQHMNN
eukprot:9325122-Pyramimonas_sp.AAC.1